eukprot:103905_1
MSKPTITTTTSSAQRIPTTPKYIKPRTQPSAMTFCETICYYKNYIFFTCLCLWATSIIIYFITSKSPYRPPPPIPSSDKAKYHKSLINDLDPAWKHPIEPWDILPRPPKGPPPPMKCTWNGPLNGFLAGCGNDGCKNHNGFEEAKTACTKDELCTGLVKVSREQEIYQLRSGGKVSDSPSGEQSWQKSCVVDHEKLNQMHRNEMKILEGKDPNQRHNKNKNGDDAIRGKKKKEVKKQDKADLVKRMENKDKKTKIESNPLNEGDEDSQKVVRNNGNPMNIPAQEHIEHLQQNRNLDAQNMDEEDVNTDAWPWAKFIPTIVNHEPKHVYDDKAEVHPGYQRPFEEKELIGELGVEEKEQILIKDLLDPTTGCFLEGPISGFIANCATDNCENHQDLESAIDKCLEDETCTGVVQIVSGQSIYQLRSDKKLRDSPRSEVTWVKLCGEKALERIKEIAAEQPPPQCFLDGPIKGFLGNCAGKDCKRYFYFNDAMVECESMGQSECVGVTRIPGLKKSFELRAIAPVISSESGEYSYLLECSAESDTKQAPIDPMDDPIIAEYEKIGTTINIEDHHTNEMVELQTIFIGIASYRDPWCFKSVHTALARARYPERIFVGVVQQNADDDPECTTPQIPCEEDPTQVLCKYASHVRMKRIHARDAAGPTYGRHWADTLYDGEYFAVQVDAHMSFVKDWDMIAIEQWSSLDNEYAILSTYPSEIASGLDEYGNPLTQSAPIICNTRMLHNGMFKHEAAGEIRFPEGHRDKPMLSPFLGAGIMFSRGHRIVRVPYDCCLPMIFDGEEFSMGARVWTHGYDLYAPYKSFAYHPYNRKKRPPLFWENQDGGRSQKSRNRIKKVLGMSLSRGQENNYDETDIDSYGLGTQRSFDLFLHVFGINLETKKVYNHCPEAFAGILHDRLHAFLRPNKRGINYQYVYVKEEEEDAVEEVVLPAVQQKQKQKQKRKQSYLNVDQKQKKKKKIKINVIKFFKNSKKS